MRPILLSALVLSLVSDGCVYDYAALSPRRDTTLPGQEMVPGSGGAQSSATGGFVGSGVEASGGAQVSGALGGSGGLGDMGGLPDSSGGQAVVTTGGQPAEIAGAAGAADYGSGGVGGAGPSVFSAGDTGGQGTGGAEMVSMAPRLLSVDFVGGYSTGGSTSGGVGGAGASSTGGKGGAGTTLVGLPAMSPTEIAGFKPASHWNAAFGSAGSLTGLVLADGTVTDASVTWNSPPSTTSPGVWRVGYADAPGDARMMNGYLDPLTPSAPATVAVSGLPTVVTMAGYDVYVYITGSVPSGTRTYGYAIGSTSFTVSQPGPTPTAFSGYALATAGGAGNFIVFRNRTDASFTLTATPGTGSQTRSPINGIQIVSPTGS